MRFGRTGRSDEDLPGAVWPYVGNGAGNTGGPPSSGAQTESRSRAEPMAV